MSSPDFVPLACISMLNKYDNIFNILDQSQASVAVIPVTRIQLSFFVLFGAEIPKGRKFLNDPVD